MYDYICIYVDDILIASSCPKRHMDMLGGHVELKKGSIQPPSTYIGTDIKKYRSTEDDREYWIL